MDNMAKHYTLESGTLTYQMPKEVDHHVASHGSPAPPPPSDGAGYPRGHVNGDRNPHPIGGVTAPPLFAKNFGFFGKNSKMT